MTQHTERKNCDECGKETVHLKKTEIIEEECLPCGWNIIEEYWKGNIQEKGLEQAKREWEDIRDSDFNKEVLLELTSEEKTKWKQVVAKTNKLFVSTQDQEQKPSNRTPYLIGGAVLIIALITGLVIYFNYQKPNPKKKP